ncbi:MAG: single-stranded DNA-binding protein [Rickettsiaceae bacterium]|nr:single-stranded DNA-binding protein [Rickettsiaceae bacterium]
MALGINKVILVGNVGQDPEIRSTTEGKKLASFSLATTETWKDRATNEKRESTEWHRVTVFAEGLVDIIDKYVKKGAKLYLEGTLRTRKWTDNAGVTKYSTEVTLSNQAATLILLDNKTDSNVSDHSSDNSSMSSKSNDYTSDDDIPF